MANESIPPQGLRSTRNAVGVADHGALPTISENEPRLVIATGGLVRSDALCPDRSHVATQTLEAARLRWMAAHDERWNDGRSRDQLMAEAAGLDTEANLAIRFRHPTRTAGGELPFSIPSEEPIGDARDRGMIETVRQPTLVKASADLSRLRKAEETSSLELSLDLNTELRAKNNLEKMIIQAMSAMYAGANELQAGAMYHIRHGGGSEAHRGNEYTSRNRTFDAMQDHNTEAAKLGTAATKQFQTFLMGAQTLAMLRRGGRQKIKVVHQHVTVNEGGQAVVANKVKTGRGAPAGRRGRGGVTQKDKGHTP